jgi:hypothetical protein
MFAQTVNVIYNMRMIPRVRRHEIMVLPWSRVQDVER